MTNYAKLSKSELLAHIEKLNAQLMSYQGVAAFCESFVGQNQNIPIFDDDPANALARFECFPPSDGITLKNYFDILSIILDFTDTLLLVLDESGKVMHVNRSLKEVFGYADTDVLGSHFWDIFIAQQNQERVKESLIAFYENGYVKSCEYLWRTKSDQKLLISCSYKMLKDPNNDIKYTAIIGRDITDIRYTEEALRDRERQLGLITDALPVLVAYVDLKECFRFNNRAFEDWFGYSQEGVTTRSVTDVLGEQIALYVRKALAGHKQSFEALISDNVTGNRYISASALPHLGEDEQVKGVVFLASDISEQNRAERRRNSRLVELARVSRVSTIDEMATALAHEINQPLCAITSYAQACERMMNYGTGGREEIASAIKAISQEATRAGEIIRGIRRFVRRDISKRNKVDINTVIEDAVNLVEPELNRYYISLSLQLGEELPPVVADSIQIEQVIINLLRNGLEAVVASDSKTRQFFIETMDKGCVEVSIRDNGVGIDPKIVDRVFDPFISTKPNGMGMGLSISRSIIESHGGRLWWVPNQAEGATFKFSLPAARQ